MALVVAAHYLFMRECWLIIHISPIFPRYIDWSITVPLQMIESYLVLLAVQPNLGGGMFWRLLFGTAAMLAFGYAGVSRVMDHVMGSLLGMDGWFYILFETFSGEIAGPLPCWHSATQASLVSWILSCASFSAWRSPCSCKWHSSCARL